MMANVPESAQELFDKQIPAALAAHPEKAKEINAVYLFKITGDDGGTWTVDLVSSPPSCTRGEKGAANCTLEIAHSDFKTVLANPAAGTQLFFTGKLRVTGDPMLAMKLNKLISFSA
jgi:putative sterol carrier protein